MRSKYKRIGDFIQLVDERNCDLSVNMLLGLSIDKIFIPSVANTVGSDMANYKVIRKWQFACSLMQVRRDKKIPVAMLKDLDEAIISQAYPVFEIKNTSELLPEYLMMWMSRSEFDREACFYAVGGVRGSLEWEDFCNMTLPVPGIEKQREVVREYQTILDRIKLNEKLNQKLEETAQAIYKQWFVDFEFPISKEYAAEIGKPELEGKPYKSSGGKMVWNDELDREIPEGWQYETLGKLVKVHNGFAFKSSEFQEVGEHPIVKIKNVTPPNTTICDAQFYNGKLSSKLRKYEVKAGDILISMTGSHMTQINSAVGKVGRYNHNKTALLNQRVGNLIPINDLPCKEYIYRYITQKETHMLLLFGSTGSANQANISPEQIETLPLLIPTSDNIEKYEETLSVFTRRTIINEHQNESLAELKETLLSKMTKAEATA